METKHQLRKSYQAYRDALPAEERRILSSQISRRLLATLMYQEAEQILVYSSIKSEVDLSDFYMQAYKDHKELFFPRVHGEEMEFYQVSEPKTDLESGCFGVMEPKTALPRFDMKDKEIPILVPGVVFSRLGQRFGYGKGYYDRYLVRYPNLLPIGVGFEVQMADELPVDIHDYNMKMVVTENCSYKPV